jgi:hypothetical protein
MAFESMKEGEKWLRDNKLLDLKDHTDASIVYNMKAFMNMGYDYTGRPNMIGIL